MKTLDIIFGLISGTWSLIVKLALIVVAIVIVVGFVRGCAANATLNEHSSCQQFEQADTGTQNKVLQDMQNAHNDQSGLSTVMFSVTLYCNTHDQSSPIDGVYNGNYIERQPAQALQRLAPRKALTYSSGAWSKVAV